jgi:hypothetical protein
MLEGRSTRQVRAFTSIELGAWYGVKGHESSGVLLPSQYIFVTHKMPRKDFWALDTIMCTHYMVMFGMLWPREGHLMNVGELGVGVGDHGINDIHLERMTFDEVALELARATGKYREIQEERVIKGTFNTAAALDKEIRG